MTLCYEYNYATLLEEVDVCYVTICCWWYSLKVVDVIGFHKLENWLSFLHFCVRKWGGFMIHIMFSSLLTHFPSHLVFMACLHNAFENDVFKHFFFL
jgi:hypothetical protein